MVISATRISIYSVADKKLYVVKEMVEKLHLRYKNQNISTESYKRVNCYGVFRYQLGLSLKRPRINLLDREPLKNRNAREG